MMLTLPWYKRLFGRAIAGRREQVILATRCGLVWERGSTTLSRRIKADSVRRKVEISLRRLNVNVIDLYPIHWPCEADEETDEGWRIFGDLIRDGKVRYGGVSNFTLAQHRRVHASRPIASPQPSHNMILRGDQAGVLPYCAANSIGASDGVGSGSRSCRPTSNSSKDCAPLP